MTFGKLILIQKCNTATAVKIVHEIIDHICGRQPPSYQTHGKGLDLQQWWDMTEDWRNFCKYCVSKCISKEQIIKALDAIPSNLQQELADAVYARKDEIRNHMVSASCNLSNSYLKDFDWQLKLVMSSDKLAHIQEPVVALNLDVVSDSENKSVLVELDKDSLKKLINSLEVANKAVTQLQT